jgi:hypothetical protein
MTEHQCLFLMMLSVGGMQMARPFLQELSLEEGDAMIRGLSNAGLIVRAPSKGPAMYELTHAGTLTFDAIRQAADAGAPVLKRRATDNMLLAAARDAHHWFDVIIADRARADPMYRPTQDPLFASVVKLHHAILGEEGS